MYAGKSLGQSSLLLAKMWTETFSFIGYLIKNAFKSTIGKIVSVVAILALIFILLYQLYIQKAKKRIYVDNYRDLENSL